MALKYINWLYLVSRLSFRYCGKKVAYQQKVKGYQEGYLRGNYLNERLQHHGTRDGNTASFLL